MNILLLLIILVGIIGLSKPARAVMPPDFVFNIGYQITQIFSLTVIFLSAIFSTMHQFIKIKLANFKFNKWHWLAVIVGILAISGGVSYFYGQYEQKIAYNNWLVESQQFDNQTNEIDNQKTIDKLKISSSENINIKAENDGSKFISNITENFENDQSAQFIQDYYSNIASHNFDKAYTMSKKAVDLATFKSWYKDTTKITLDSLTRIDDKKSSLALTLYEGDRYIKYAVLMTLLLENNAPTQVEKSEVRILEQGAVVANSQPLPVSKPIVNNDSSIFISNKEFQAITTSNRNDYIVLDAREDIEYANGYFPGSVHIRFADLQAGRWIEIPSDKFVYVICWSGIRGKEVANFLQTKNIMSSYLENGANGWVESGGKWTGNILFATKYFEERYRLVLSTADVKEKMAEEGVQLVDSREPWKYKQSHIPGSVSIPIMHTPTTNLEDSFNQVKPNSQIIIICDGYVNCFDAKITGVELEARGRQLLGRYNKPWEY